MSRLDQIESELDWIDAHGLIVRAFHELDPQWWEVFVPLWWFQCWKKIRARNKLLRIGEYMIKRVNQVT